jgi:predicted nucleic acid-binding protein
VRLSVGCQYIPIVKCPRKQSVPWWRIFVVPYSVVRETATVLVCKESKAIADAFLAYVQASTNILLFEDSGLEGEILTFVSESSRISFTDCSLLHYMRAGYGELRTYDKQLARLARRAV